MRKCGAFAGGVRSNDQVAASGMQLEGIAPQTDFAPFSASTQPEHSTYLFRYNRPNKAQQPLLATDHGIENHA